MPKITLQPSTARVPSAPYVPGTKRGPFVFTAGQVSVDGGGNLVGEGDVGAQTRQVLQNIQGVLEEGGYGDRGCHEDDSVSRRTSRDFAAMNEVYALHFLGKTNPPGPRFRPHSLLRSSWSRSKR